MAHPRGRRPGESRASDEILAAARRRFAEFGFRGTTLREIADDADVDVRLIAHYFGSKADLFVHAVELPFDPEPTFDAFVAGGREDLGRRIATFLITGLSQPAFRETYTGLIRAAASEEDAARMVRESIVERLLLPLARRLGDDHVELRAGMMGSLFAGLVVARHIVEIPSVATAPDDLLIDLIAPVIDHYLTDPMPPR